ncbi:hypothetical protein ACHRVW_15515 [Flavobacterium collinsii]|uniref:hypothetical protein n=1 Tax=Flavobacterium collinsii TaxID=1114861 RepID=UPI003756DACA
MKKIFTSFIFILLFACNSKQKQQDSTITKTKEEIPTEKIIAKNSKPDAVNYQISIYDNPKAVDQIMNHKESLKQLSEKNIFLDIHTKLLQKLPEEQQSFFQKNPDYELLSLAEGSLFEEKSNDFAFIVYDKKKVKISIVVYNATTSKYALIFQDIKVVNGIKNGDCNSSSFGTFDYQFALDFFIYNQDYLEKSTASYLEYPNLKITDISKDKDFVLNKGCFSKKVLKTNLAHTLCIATSSVYSNWDCLRYDKTNNTFLIFYTQAFAD